MRLNESRESALRDGGDLSSLSYYDPLCLNLLLGSESEKVREWCAQGEGGGAGGRGVGNYS